MVFLVSYTLYPTRLNKELIEELQKSPRWAHYLDTTWLIATNETAAELYERLRTKFLATDHFLITQFHAGAQYYGWLAKEAWSWINETAALGWIG